MQAKGKPGNFVLVPRGTKPGTVLNTPQGKVILDVAPGANSSQSGTAKMDFLVTTENVEAVLNKALACTESMSLLLQTLKEELNNSKRPGVDAQHARTVKLALTRKMRRALDAQVRTFSEIRQFSQSTAAPKVAQVPGQSGQQQKTSPLKPSSAQSTPVKPQDLPELKGLNIGQVVTPSGLNSAVGKNVIIAKETLSTNVQLVTLSDGRVLAVQTVPGGVKKAAPSNNNDIIELDSSDDESPKKDSPPAKKYKPGPKCSKVNRPGPKCSKVYTEYTSDSDAKKDKFKMRISLGAKSFPGASGSQNADKSASEEEDSSAEDDKPLKPKEDKKDSRESSDKESEKEKEDSDEEKKKDDKPTTDDEDSKDFKKDEDDDNGGSKSNDKGSDNSKDSQEDSEMDHNGTGNGDSSDTKDTKKEESDGSAGGEQIMEVDEELLRPQLDGTGKENKYVYRRNLHCSTDVKCMYMNCSIVSILLSCYACRQNCAK